MSCGLIAAALFSPLAARPGGIQIEDRTMNQPVDDARFARAGKHHAFTLADMKAALNRREPLGLKPLKPSSSALSDEAYHRHAALATLAMYSISEAGDKAGEGARLGTAFMVQKGVAVTCFHAFKGLGDRFAAVGVTCDGKPVRVTRILAAYPQEDLVFLQVEGAGPGLLPLRPNVPAGMKVRALGHPLNKYFFMVEGMIARYGYKTGADKQVRLNLMIDSIGGFSGSAIMDAAGNAVGMLDSFDTIKAGEATYDVHSAIPAATILAHFTTAYTSSMSDEDEAAELKVGAGAESAVQVSTLRTESPEGVAIADVRSDRPHDFKIRIEDANGKEVAKGRPSPALRESLPDWAKKLYDECCKAAEKQAARTTIGR